MSDHDALPGRQGAIVWAITPYDVEDPFRVVRHDGSETRYGSGTELAQAVLRRELAPEFDLAVSAKVRPVLLLQDRPVHRFEDYIALPLTRVEKFPSADQQLIRDQREETLFHLGHDKAKYGLDKEYAVRLSGLHRVHTGAIVSGRLGGVDRAELRTICERLVRVADLDISNLVVREGAAFVRRLQEGDR